MPDNSYTNMGLACLMNAMEALRQIKLANPDITRDDCVAIHAEIIQSMKEYNKKVVKRIIKKHFGG